MQGAKMPAYERIAIDLANRIYDEKFKVGEKIRGRSTLASEYNVSPETVRKAIKILEDVEIVESTKGSGVVISSRENAFKYIERFSGLTSIKELEKQVRTLIGERKKLDDQLSQSIDKMMDFTGKLRHTNPLTPIEIEIPESCTHIGKTVSELKFWQNTGGTIVGIKRLGELILSPGPYASIQVGDVLLIIGNDETHERVIYFIEEE
ncbi:regulatory protein, gntR family [Mesobacillus persicus]|uniref:Regulatory protein, gntR family n=1 Tax=Mesobacillus persicus TaxID=930146 RepID=A0A1H8CFX2_9BACI|nr:TrkA C-terminal domain-containing protein [Mesobacillus persicus]SEM93916.1 regulatory protein, gntR family [Mesobacillus persicus]